MLYTFIPNFYSFDSYQSACNAQGMTAKPYAYGALSKSVLHYLFSPQPFLQLPSPRPSTLPSPPVTPSVVRLTSDSNHPSTWPSHPPQSSVPTFTMRSLGDERTWGCEAPYFNFDEDVEVGPFNLHGNSYCKVRLSPTSHALLPTVM